MSPVEIYDEFERCLPDESRIVHNRRGWRVGLIAGAAGMVALLSGVGVTNWAITSKFDGLQGKHIQRGEEKDGGPTDCTAGNGEVHKFTVDGVTRCFTLVTPESAHKPMPVVVYFHGKGSRANVACRRGTELAKAAESMGFALLCADAYQDWQFPRVDGAEGVNSDKPQPCTSDDTPEVDYMKKVLETVQGDGETYDSEKIYFQGFSQGAMMTSWAATCFADQIRGVSQAGGGLKLAKAAVTEEWCAGSSSTRCSVGVTDGNNIPGGSCPNSSPCEYFPIKTTNKKNVIGEDLKWCLFAGCSDYLLGSTLSQDQHLGAEGVPHELVFYDSPHQAPINWMPKVAECHGWDSTPEVDEEPWLEKCLVNYDNDRIDLGINEGKICEGKTGVECGCPKSCNEDTCWRKDCSETCEFCTGGV